MATSRTTSKKYLQPAQRECQLRGFVKIGANWYRQHGEALLQVITFNGLPQRITDINYKNQPSVSFIVYSLYEQIPWINVPIMQARRDVIPNISASVFFHQSTDVPFLGPEYETQYMINSVFPFLDELNTQEQFAAFLENIDRWEYGKIRLNDRKKIVPYLLSGKWQQALDVIDAIENQNKQAYQRNCKTAIGSGSAFQEQKISQSLEQLISLRDNIVARNSSAIIALLRSNYHNNIQRLQAMGVPGMDQLPGDCNFRNLVFY